MTKEQYENSIERGAAFKFIAPAGKWQCFCCLRDYRQLEVLKQTELDIFLICAYCAAQTERAQTEQRSLYDDSDYLNRIF